MDLRTLSLGERIAAVSGVVLFGLLFASWLENENAWQLFDIVDVLLVVLALAAVALPLAKAMGREPVARASVPAMLTRIGIVTLTITATFLIEAEDLERELGIFLAVLASAGILYGGLTTPRAEAVRRTRDRPRRPVAPEQFEHPPPGMGGRRGTETVAVGDEQEPDATAEPTPEPPRLARERRFEADEDLSW
ncbi:MAG: hypothetical protein M3088_02410, partial [Actinomycetota bacterium]|nr:hypothetical protein [Actinomycetota bacterium]